MLIFLLPRNEPFICESNMSFDRANKTFPFPNSYTYAGLKMFNIVLCIRIIKSAVYRKPFIIKHLSALMEDNMPLRKPLFMQEAASHAQDASLTTHILPALIFYRFLCCPRKPNFSQLRV